MKPTRHLSNPKSQSLPDDFGLSLESAVPESSEWRTEDERLIYEAAAESLFRVGMNPLGIVLFLQDLHGATSRAYAKDQ